jgi:adenine-specific DNA methylase
VLGSLLPTDFPRDVFERLLGFGHPGKVLLEIRRRMDAGIQVEGGFNCNRAFKRFLRPEDLEQAHKATREVWGDHITVVDPMAGGGSIPLESARLGFRTLANEYNPVACTVLEATVDYPFRFGSRLADKARTWGKEWERRITKRLAPFFPVHKLARVHAYIFARTVPCPDTQYSTPLVPDWHLLNPKKGVPVVAEPVVDKAKGTWSVHVREVGQSAGQLKVPPAPTYGDGKGISLFTGRQIPGDYVKAKAQAGEMESALYAVALKTNQGLEFRQPGKVDLDALHAAERALADLRSRWEREDVIPTEPIPIGDQPGARLEIGGITTWADLFAPRQLLCFGVLVEELRRLRTEIVAAEGMDLAEAIVHMLALVVDKLANHNCVLARFENTRQVIKGIFGRHGYEFHPTHAEMAPCNSGRGLEWAIDNVLDAYEELAAFAENSNASPAVVSLGSSTSLPELGDGSITAVVVDPPYADNVQYAELANFFYVWLKRMQGHRRPEWFSTYLCERDLEAVVNISRFRQGKKKAKNAKAEAHAFYQGLMTDTFRECCRVLRDDGVLTVMFTHKKQEAWAALFESLIAAGFTITATWPAKTESEHSLHQAKKNAAQSTVILVARKRRAGAGIAYFDRAIREEIRAKVRASAERLAGEGLNPVDQLVGSFGPAMEVFSRYDAVRTDTGLPVSAAAAIDEAAEAVSAWRIEQLAQRGLEGVEPEGRFALLCWDVLGAVEFRFNEASLLGRAVGMDVDRLLAAGLVEKSGEKILMLPARERRRERALDPDEVDQTLFGPVVVPKKRTKRDALKVHPNDPFFRTSLDACHALALRYLEGDGGAAGVGAAKGLVRQQQWSEESAVARLMEALVKAAPLAVRLEDGKKSAAALFPEFRAWHALLKPLFGIEPPDWSTPVRARILEDEFLDAERDEETEEGQEGAEE